MIDDILEFIIDFFLELFIWEQLNDFLRERIGNRFLRWTVATVIYLLIFGALLAFLVGLGLLIRNLL